jgi:endonuclease/exonuclease/phosphatase family metal-dependent hydrolase
MGSGIRKINDEAGTMALKLLTYNIHKGYTLGNTRFILNELRAAIRDVHADLVLLQEVTVRGEYEAEKQFEFLADEVWKHYAYGKNAVYTAGHHGNAILSKFPIESVENEDVSLSRFERRGLLHAQIVIPEISKKIHLMSVHLGLFEKDRSLQVDRLVSRIQRMAKNEALIVGGDFNDWRERYSQVMEDRLGCVESFHALHQEHPKTYPGAMPLFRLDRIYSRGFRIVKAHVLRGKTWARLSDHLPLCAELEIE